MRKITLAATLLNLSLSVGADTTPLLQGKTHEKPFTNLAFESSRQTINDVQIKSDTDIKRIEDWIFTGLSPANEAFKKGLLGNAAIFLPKAKSSTKLFQNCVEEWKKAALSKEEKYEVTAAERDVLAHLARLKTLELLLQ